MAERQVEDVDAQRRPVGDRELDRLDDVARVAAAVVVEDAQRDDAHARGDALVVAAGAGPVRRDQVRHVRPVTVAVRRGRAHRRAAAEVVRRRDVQLAARRHARVDHRDADAAPFPVRAAVGHRPADDRVPRGGVGAGAARAGRRRGAGVVGRLVDLDGRVDRDAFDFRQLDELQEVVLLHLREDPVDQREAEPVGTPGRPREALRHLGLREVDADTRADDDAHLAALALTVNLGVEHAPQAPIELVEPRPAPGTTFTAPRLRSRDVRGDDTGKQPHHDRRKGSPHARPVEHAPCHPGRRPRTRSSHCATDGYDRAVGAARSCP